MAARPFSSPEPVVSWSRGRETRGRLQIKPSGSGDENFADVSPRETSPAAKSEEKRMFSQASERNVPLNLGTRSVMRSAITHG